MNSNVIDELKARISELEPLLAQAHQKMDDAEEEAKPMKLIYEQRCSEWYEIYREHDQLSKMVNAQKPSPAT